MQGNQYFPPVDDEALLEPIFEAAKKVNALSLFDLATEPYPPKGVQEVFESVCMLLGLHNDWGRVKNLIGEEQLVPMIEEFHPESVPDLYLEQLSQIMTLPEMQVDSLAKYNEGVGQIGAWLQAISLYYDAKHKPMQFESICEVKDEVVAPVEVKETESPKETKKDQPPPKRVISIKEALESIKNLNKQDIMEVKGYKTPPAGVLLVLEALCILFDAMKVERKGNQIVYEPNYKKLLQDYVAFVKKVLDLDYDKISLDKIKRLRKYIEKPEFDVEKVRKASSAAASFSLLINSIVQKYDEKSLATSEVKE